MQCVQSALRGKSSRLSCLETPALHRRCAVVSPPWWAPVHIRCGVRIAHACIEPTSPRKRDNPVMPRHPDSPLNTTVSSAPHMTEPEIDDLQSLLDNVPAPLEPLDVSMLDGFLCGLLVQPKAVPVNAWMPHVTDVDGRALPHGFDAVRLHALVRRRHAELNDAIAHRQWFDPWVFELDEDVSPAETVLPWVAGFAAAMDRFPALLRTDDARLLEPLALLYMHFDPADLEDADALGPLIDTLEPPRDLGEAVQDLVRSLMLIADVVHPVAAAPVRRRPGHARSTGRRR